MGDLTHVLRLLGRKSKSPYFRQEKSFSSPIRQQVCILKANYGRSLQSHKKFLETYMPQKNKDGVEIKPKIFGNVSDEEYKSNITPDHIKFVLSPETSLDEKSLKTFTEIFMERVSFETGFNLSWQAACHTDTAHPHVHVVINGIDRDGKKVHFRRDFIKCFGRMTAQETLTSLIGERTQEQILSAQDRRVTARRFTSLDEEIERCLSTDESGCYYPGHDFTLLRRLDELYKMGLAEYRKGHYCLKDDWKETLVATGRYNMFLDAKDYIKTPSLKLYSPEDGIISGTVRHIYRMNDEDVWTNALVIESTERSFFVPLYKPVRGVKEDSEITLSAEKSQKGKFTVKTYVNKKGPDIDSGYSR